MSARALGDRAIGPDEPPFIMAELGVNHDGDPLRAIALVDAAADVGADAIKLQYFRADLLMGTTARLAEYQVRSGARDPHTMLTALELDEPQLLRVCAHARNRGLAAVVTVFSTDLVERATTLGADAFKTASPDIIHRPLLDALARTGCPLIVSTGASTEDEVRRAAGWLAHTEHIFLQCVSAYPTPDHDAFLGGLRTLHDVTGGVWGYSDHTTSEDAGALAVAAGACVLEKHFTLDRAAEGPDHAASLEPDALGRYVRGAHRAWKMLGRGPKRVLDVEQDVRAVSRQSITTTRDLPRGHVLEPVDLTCRRPGTGLAPCELADVIGRSLSHGVNAGQPLTHDDLRGAR